MKYKDKGTIAKLPRDRNHQRMLTDVQTKFVRDFGIKTGNEHQK